MMSEPSAASPQTPGDLPVSAAGLRPWLRLLLGMGGSAVLFACGLAMLVVFAVSTPLDREGNDHRAARREVRAEPRQMSERDATAAATGTVAEPASH